MKKAVTYVIILLTVFTCSCAMFKHEMERSINKDIEEHMEENFDAYATNWWHGKWDTHKKKFMTNVGIISATLGVVATTLGLLAVIRKLRKKDEDV